MKFKQKIKDFVANKNFKRALFVYIASFAIGIAGLLTLGSVGMYIFTCSPGFGSGLAVAFLGNGNKKKVTLGSVLKTFAITTVLAGISWIIGIPVPAFLLGTAFSYVGTFAGLQIINLEHKIQIRKNINMSDDTEAFNFPNFEDFNNENLIK